MPRWWLQVVRDGGVLRVQYGFSPLLGHWAVVFRPDGTRAVYDRSIPDYGDLPGLLDFLARTGVFDRGKTDAAAQTLRVTVSPEDIEDPEVRQIVVNLTQAAAERAAQEKEKMDSQKVTTSVHERLDQPGYIVNVEVGEGDGRRIARLRVDDLDEARALAESIAGLASVPGGFAGIEAILSGAEEAQS